MVNRLGKPMDQASLQRMLKGERDISLYEAYQLSELLGIDLTTIAAKALNVSTNDLESSIEEADEIMKIFGIDENLSKNH